MRRSHQPSAPTTPPARSHLTCDACPHEWGTHDPVGTRYCSVTIAAGLDRACVCVAEVPMFEQRPR